jgi:hypothetical protein
MRKLMCTFSLVMVVFCAVPQAGAETIICGAVADVTIDEWNPDENFNFRDRLTLATNKNIHHGIARVLLLFDIPNSIDSSEIRRAEIFLSGCSHCGGANGGLVGFFALEEPFDEDRDTWNSLEGVSWDTMVSTAAPLPDGASWNQAVDGQPPPNAAGMDVTQLLRENLEKVRRNGIMMRFLDEHPTPSTHQNVASRESADPRDFAPFLQIQTHASPCPAERVLKDSAEDLVELRRFRDMVLAQTAAGRLVIQIYYRQADAVTALLATNKRFATQTHSVLKMLIPAIRGINNNRQAHTTP